jgi:hypothetical protein
VAKRFRDSVRQYAKWIKSGRGGGRGSEYSPWLTVQDVPSIAPATRVLGMKTGRMHQVLSNLELNYFYVLDWAQNVTDIREQFPLLPIEETKFIANELGVKHPAQPGTKQPIVMTTDFVVDVDEVTVARNCKYEKDLLDKRVSEKLEIERRYWLRRGVNFQVVSEKTFSPTLIANVKFIRKAYNLDWNELGINEKMFLTAKNLLRSAFEEDRNLIPAYVCLDLDELLGMKAGTTLFILRHMLARREIRVDMDATISPREPLPLV